MLLLFSGSGLAPLPMCKMLAGCVRTVRATDLRKWPMIHVAEGFQDRCLQPLGHLSAQRNRAVGAYPGRGVFAGAVVGIPQSGLLRRFGSRLSPWWVPVSPVWGIFFPGAVSGLFPPVDPSDSHRARCTRKEVCTWLSGRFRG